MTLNEDYASRIRQIADRLPSLDPDRRDPHRFHETKDAVEQDLRSVANAIEIDQVFAKRDALPRSVERPAFRTGPRTIQDRKGRAVTVETRRRPALKQG